MDKVVSPSMSPFDYPLLIYSQNMHFNLTDHFGLNFVVAAHKAFYSTLLRGDLYSSVIHNWNRQLKPY